MQTKQVQLSKKGKQNRSSNCIYDKGERKFYTSSSKIFIIERKNHKSAVGVGGGRKTYPSKRYFERIHQEKPNSSQEAFGVD